MCTCTGIRKVLWLLHDFCPHGILFDISGHRPEIRVPIDNTGVWTEEFRMNDRGLAEGDVTGKIKLLLDAKERPIGVQILGLHAGELIGEWVAAMRCSFRTTRSLLYGNTATAATGWVEKVKIRIV
jgi:hypothetical protein